MISIVLWEHYSSWLEKNIINFFILFIYLLTNTHSPLIKGTNVRAKVKFFNLIYFWRLGEVVNFILSYITNVTILISIIQIIRPWVAIFQLRPSMAFLYRSLYYMPGLAPHIYDSFWGRHDFQISVSNRYTSRSAWNRHWGFLMVDTGILSNKTKFFSHEY